MSSRLVFRWVQLLCELFAASAARAAAPVSFTRDVAPTLAKKCVTCHGPEKAKGNYQLHNFELLLKPGASQAVAVTPGEIGRAHV